MIAVLSSTYLAAVALLSLYGVLGLVTFSIYLRCRRSAPGPTTPSQGFPPVTIQIPVYNERFVIERAIQAALRLEYPPEKLQIQIVDDSTDDTTELALKVLRKTVPNGPRAELVRRSQRQGFKAGALAQALNQATGDYLAVFDADFIPSTDFLLRTVPIMQADPKIGMVQSRWEHTNWNESLITGAQAIALDKHFAVEQAVRFHADFFPKFNGSGGIWRRACLEDVGGWQSDTLCEDLCLSIRAILQGWQLRYLSDLTSPAELPRDILSYKTQQARWAHGSTQCLMKFGRSILGARPVPLVGRVYAILTMAGYMTSFMLLLLVLILPWLVWHDHVFPPYLLLAGVIGATQPALFLLAQKDLHRDWLVRSLHLPALLVLAIGLTPTVARAVFQALRGRRNPFVRTAKDFGTGFYTPGSDWLISVEVLLAIYSTGAIIACVLRDNYRPLVLFVACALGFGTIAWSSLRRRRSYKHPAR